MKYLEMLTEDGIYTSIVDPDKYQVDDQTTTEEQLFDLARIDVLGECFLYGWTPTDDIKKDPPFIFTLESAAKIISIKMYEYNSVGTKESTGDVTPTPNTVYPFTCFGDYLSNKVKITGVAYKTDTTEYILPVFANGQPATEYMKPATLAQQMQLCKEAEGTAPTDYIIIIPDVWLDEKNATEYLTAYVKEAEPQTALHGEGKAMAWSGWKET